MRLNFAAGVTITWRLLHECCIDCWYFYQDTMIALPLPADASSCNCCMQLSALPFMYWIALGKHKSIYAMNWIGRKYENILSSIFHESILRNSISPHPWWNCQLPSSLVGLLWCLALSIWGRDETATISQTFSNTFSWMKMCRFRWSVFPSFELIAYQEWFREWLGADQATSHYLNQWRLAY